MCAIISWYLQRGQSKSIRDLGNWEIGIRELIALSALNDAVQDKDVSISRGLEDKYVLVERLLDM